MSGRYGDRRIKVTVTLPDGETAAVDYQDPDGGAPVCHHSTRADAEIVLQRRTRGTWVPEREWSLAARAHAEVGLRP